MRQSYKNIVVLCGVLLSVCHSQAQSVERSPEGIAVLNQSFKVLGGNLPGTSSLSATFIQEVGGSRDEGVLTVLTRGTEETSETYAIGSTTRTLVYANGFATERVSGAARRLSAERSLASRSSIVPILLIGVALQNSSYTVSYIAAEALSGKSAHHLRITRNAVPDGAPADLATFSTKDIWIDEQSYLPLVISWDQRDARGDAPGLRYALTFSDFRAVEGVLFPFSIVETLNGTRYLTIRTTSASIGVGLSDSDFPL